MTSNVKAAILGLVTCVIVALSIGLFMARPVDLNKVENFRHKRVEVDPYQNNRFKAENQEYVGYGCRTYILHDTKTNVAYLVVKRGSGSGVGITKLEEGTKNDTK